MKNKLIYFMLIALAISACSQKGPIKNVKLKTATDSASYAIGVIVGVQNNYTIESVPGGEDINLEIMSAAFRKASVKEETKMTIEEAYEYIQIYFEGIGQRQAQKNLEEGNAFLEKNKSRAGVQVTASGLQYEIITAGTGEKPRAEDQVRAHYHGTIISGEVFDSSVERGEPVVFPVSGEMIMGWTEALQLMPVGGKWKFYMPSYLAYGEQDRGGMIGPNTVLIFEIELLEIIK